MLPSPTSPAPRSLSRAMSHHLGFVAIVTVGILSVGCSSNQLVTSHSCSRVALDPPPPWTASAAWNADEGKIVLVDPGSRSLATYDLAGHRLRSTTLDAASDLSFSEPMRFERERDGYVLIGKTQVLRLDDNLNIHQRQEPFARLAGHGLVEGSFNDVVMHRGRFFGYADFVEPSESVGGDEAGGGTWRRGFVRVDPERRNLTLIHELEIDSADNEFASYYLYDRRPYVAELEGKIYVLRFTEPWSLSRVTRRGLRPVASGEAGSGRAHAVQVWNDRLYVVTSHLVPVENAESMLTAARLQAVGQEIRAELKAAMPSMQAGERRWLLHEIDPKNGHRRQMRLPTSAQRLRLVPGHEHWTAIEESSAPNLGAESDGTTFLFLPASEILSGSFSCESEKSRLAKS